MKLIIAGTRTLEVSIYLIESIIKHFNLDPTEIVSGGAKGVDKAGETFAVYTDSLDVTIFQADWDKHGKAAGPIRNREMSQYADALLLIWDGESRGAANMKLCMSQLCKPIYEVILDTAHVK